MRRPMLGRLAGALALASGVFSHTVASAPTAGAASPATVVSVSAGYGHSCAVTGPNGGLKCWGLNDDGELGTGFTTSTTRPVSVSGLSSKVAAVSAGGSRTCAVTTAGALKCWGDKPGNGTPGSLTPVSPTGLASGVKAVSAGGTFTCALTTSGGVKCWGSGSLGQLGDGNLTFSYAPVTPTGLGSGVAAISAGAQHACALLTAGGVKCWGWNNYGETGDQSGATTTPAPVGVSFAEGTSIASIAVGGYHSCVITGAGGALCWGQDQYGQLGDGNTMTNSIMPVAVSGLSSGVTALTGGTYHTCAVVSGAAKCWGTNNTGNLGNGTTTDSAVPVDVIGLDSGVTRISAGRGHTCAVRSDGRALCWGWNLFGQVGNGTTSVAETVPIVVSISK
jgi:alpha-tubulin suppressor-like RCC1 family protein